MLSTGKTRLSVHGWLHSSPVEQRPRHVEPLSAALMYVDIEVSKVQQPNVVCFLSTGDFEILLLTPGMAHPCLSVTCAGNCFGYSKWLRLVTLIRL